jgi:hypothetical protein
MFDPKQDNGFTGMFTAFRLGQLNKQYGTRILIGENTHTLAKVGFIFFKSKMCS